MAAKAKSGTGASHRWNFFRAGGVDQVRLDTGADIVELHTLDQKLWVALSCPTKGLEFDEQTLKLLDADGDGFVRPPEILAATRWVGQVLKDPDQLVDERDGVSLGNVRTDTAEGKAVLASAKRLVLSLGKEKATEVTVSDAEQAAGALTTATHNGDGVVPPENIGDEAARKVATEIVDCLGGVADRSGKKGIDEGAINAFFADCAAFDAWYRTGESDAKSVLPLGDGTAAASAALDAVRAKIDDFFGRCRLAAYDPRAQAALNREEKAYLELTSKDLSITADEIASFPLAMVEAKKALPLVEGVNPAWAGKLATFRSLCCKDKAQLTEAEWIALCGKLDAHKAWAGSKAGAAVEKLGIKRVREILGGKHKDALLAAVAEDKAVAAEIDGIAQVEKLARLHRDLHKLLCNYVSFTDFYARRGAIFQAGTLHFDGRTCDLTFHVNDAGKHGSLAAMAKTYLAYVDCTRPGGQKMTVACAFTAGDNDNLFVGRNGIFYDRKGNDWNATITKIIDNPISIGQAFWSPYKKLMRWIEETVAKRAAAADEGASARLQSAAAATGEAAKTGAAPKDKPKFDVGVVAALGVAVGGITAALTGLLDAFFGLGPWIPLGLVGLMLAISGPSMLIAWLKLRQRNLGPILDANGWAVNTLTRVNLPLGRSLTDLQKLPEGASRSLVDPYAPKKSVWPKVILFLLILAGVGFGLYRFNFLNKWFPDYIPAYVSASFDGPSSGFAGGDALVIKLGSGAKEVAVSGLEGVTSLPVVNGEITVPMANAKEGSKITLTDQSTAHSQVHDIAVVKKP
ncbi:MAG: hypothetical protein U1F36_03455 [Planctomycetota bacterium]